MKKKSEINKQNKNKYKQKSGAVKRKANECEEAGGINKME
jgi:hypothetical protein